MNISEEPFRELERLLPVPRGMKIPVRRILEALLYRCENGCTKESRTGRVWKLAGHLGPNQPMGEERGVRAGMYGDESRAADRADY